MKIQIPTNCPCCGYPLQLVNDQLFCRNSACEVQLNKKIENFAKVLGIKGLGEKSIEKLALSDLTELFYLDRDDIAKSLGSLKIADKLISEIERAKTATLSKVLASFSIPLIGNTASTKVSKVVKSIEEITPEKCKEAGLGEKATTNLMNWLATEYEEMKEFLPFNFISEESSNAGGKTVCITGKLKSFKTKADATKTLTELGYRVVESITKTTDFLVDEDNKNSSKRQKADEYGITIINNLIDFIKVNHD